MPAPEKNDSRTDSPEIQTVFREGLEKKTGEARTGHDADLPETKKADPAGENRKENDQKKDRRIYILSREKPALAVVKLGVPLIAGMFIMVLYNMVDTYFIGLMRDDYQLAAVNLAYPVMMISIAISNMIGTGASSLIARSLGAEDRAKARHTLTVGFELTIINSLLVTAAGMAFLTAIVRGLGAQSNTFEYTRQYVQVILLGSIFTMGNYTFGQLLRSEGSVRYSVAGMITGTVVNIILDPVFIFYPGPADPRCRDRNYTRQRCWHVCLTVDIREWKNTSDAFDSISYPNWRDPAGNLLGGCSCHAGDTSDIGCLYCQQ